MCCVFCITIHTHRAHVCYYQLLLWDSRSYGTIHTWKLSLSHLMLALGAPNSVDETLLWDANCCSNIPATPYPLLNTEIKSSPLYLDPDETVLVITACSLKICFNIFCQFMFWTQFSHLYSVRFEVLIVMTEKYCLLCCFCSSYCPLLDNAKVFEEECKSWCSLLCSVL